MGDITSSARIASVIAATAISLACGTNYAYSAWGPSFALRLELSTTQQNLIGVAGNVGMYAMGIPAGFLVDTKGPRAGILFGAIALVIGYYPLYRAYEGGPGSINLYLACFLYFLTGCGSCTAFSAAIKTATYNWPNNRGTATAFPLSGFGLSAFVFATLARVSFDGNPGGFLLLLSLGTLTLNLTAFFFIRLIPPTPDQISMPEDRLDETLSLVSERPSLDLDGTHAHNKPRFSFEKSQTLDMTGLKLLAHSEFWHIFSMMCLLAGVGLLTINNIGNDVRALLIAMDPNTSSVVIQGAQQFQTAILSIASFLGRLLSGIGSDILIKRLQASRIWCLTASATIFTLSQLLALIITNPNLIFLVSTLTGVGYGALFGTFPAIVADKFGVTNLSVNWGAILMAPVVSGNVYNICYGRIFDANAGADGICHKGIGCYRSAYWITSISSIIGIALSLYLIRNEQSKIIKTGAIHRRA